MRVWWLTLPRRTGVSSGLVWSWSAWFSGGFWDLSLVLPEWPICSVGRNWNDMTKKKIASYLAFQLVWEQLRTGCQKDDLKPEHWKWFRGTREDDLNTRTVLYFYGWIPKTIGRLPVWTVWTVENQSIKRTAFTSLNINSVFCTASD